MEEKTFMGAITAQKPEVQSKKMNYTFHYFTPEQGNVSEEEVKTYKDRSIRDLDFATFIQSFHQQKKIAETLGYKVRLEVEKNAWNNGEHIFYEVQSKQKSEGGNPVFAYSYYIMTD